MSPDEIFVLIFSGMVLFSAWAPWYWQAATVAAKGPPREGRPVLRVVPLLCIGLLWLVLRTVASFDVRDDWRYLLMYTTMGMAWLGAVVRITAFAGVSMRDDVLERRNGAAAIAIGGAMLGITLAFAGGNIGDGPGWWVVVFSAGLSTLSLFVLWLILDAATGVSDSVTIDRDRASALRLAGFLIAAGIIFGRAAAGDWVSTAATVRDFVIVGAPAILLLVLAILIERAYRPSGDRPEGAVAAQGMMPALVYVLLGVGYVAAVGVGA